MPSGAGSEATDLWTGQVLLGLDSIQVATHGIFTKCLRETLARHLFKVGEVCIRAPVAHPSTSNYLFPTRASRGKLESKYSP